MHHSFVFSSLVATLAIAALAPAQTFVTSPRGYDTVEGETTFFHFSDSSDRRFQQIDATHVTNSFLVNSLGWRRNGTGSGGGTNEPPRTMDLEVSMGVADMTILSHEFDPNFLPGSRQVVFIKKQVSMPDWTGTPSTPAPFDFQVALDTPFPYGGAFGLVVDFTYENVQYVGGGASGGSSVDRGYIGASTATGGNLGSGCTASGQTQAFTHAMRLENNGPGGVRYGMRLRAEGDNAPANAAVFLNIDFSDQNLSFPGLCTTLHAGPALSLPLGVASLAGDLPQTSVSFPFTAGFIGATVVTQLSALDPGAGGIPVVLSNGETASFPSSPSSTSNDCVYHWDTLPDDVGTLFFGGGMVLQLGI